MVKIQDLHKILSQENKALKPKHAYKTAEEGIFGAYYFFRWADKKNYETLDQVVEDLVKDKIPEKHLEHFLEAWVMRNCYQVDETTRDSLRYIHDGFVKKTGKDIWEGIRDVKTRKRLQKNVWTVFSDAKERLKGRTKYLNTVNRNVWIVVGVVLLINLALVSTGVYGGIFKVIEKSPVLEVWGWKPVIGGLVITVILSLAVLFMYNSQLSELSRMGSRYPHEIEKMEKELAELTQIINSNNGTSPDKK